MEWIQIKTLIILFLSFFCVQYSFSIEYIEVWPYEIKFDHERRHEYDAVAICKNASEDIPVPEWKYGVRSEKFAYIKAQSNRTIQIRFDSNCDSMHLLVNLSVYSGTGIGEVCNYFVANYNRLDSIILTLDGSVPNSVGKRDFTWEWEIYAIPKNPGYCSDMSDATTTHTYYTLLDDPEPPMGSPWTDVLDYACVWASGESTESGVLSSLADELYNSDLDYDGGQSHYEYVAWPTAKMVFDLTDFLYDWDEADCQDCGMFYSILSSSLGAPLTETRRIEGPFDTKNIDPLGPTWGWNTYGWNFHHIGWLNNVYDPSIKLDYYSQYIPININIDNPYKTDLYDSGDDWIPQDPFQLGYTDPYFELPTEIQ